VFTARYALSPYIKQICFVFKGLIKYRQFYPYGHHYYMCSEQVISVHTFGRISGGNVEDSCYNNNKNSVISLCDLYKHERIYIKAQKSH
jgi:hypothetical protein